MGHSLRKGILAQGNSYGLPSPVILENGKSPLLLGRLGEESSFHESEWQPNGAVTKQSPNNVKCERKDFGRFMRFLDIGL